MSKTYNIDFIYSQDVSEYGYFGIGTSHPQKLLDVKGDINYSGNLYNNETQVPTWNRTSNMMYFNTGNVGIGTNDPCYNLDVSGSIQAESYITSSDKRFKTNIEDENLGLQYINSLKPKIYNYIDKSGDYHGFIAQDILQTDNYDIIDTDINGYYNLELQDLISPIVKSLQELKKENDYLESRLKTLLSTKVH